MNLTTGKVHLFDMPWTDDADYEHLYEDRLHDQMIPFFAHAKKLITDSILFGT